MTKLSLKPMIVLAAIASLPAACAPSRTSQPTPTSLAAMALEMTANAPTPTAPIRPTLPTTTSLLARPEGRTPTPAPVGTQLAATATALSGIVTIEVGDYYYRPQVVTITVGTTVIWEPVGYLFHTIAPVDPPAAWRGGGTSGAGSPAYEFTFKKPGTYKYTCDYHPSAMDAWVVVVEDD